MNRNEKIAKLNEAKSYIRKGVTHTDIPRLIDVSKHDYYAMRHELGEEVGLPVKVIASASKPAKAPKPAAQSAHVPYITQLQNENRAMRTALGGVLVDRFLKENAK